MAGTRSANTISPRGKGLIVATILIVDDDPFLRALLCEFLKGLGHRVATAPDGAEGLARIRKHRPDVLVLDLQMPVMDGWSVLRTCRDTVELADLPVVVISAMSGANATLAELNVACFLAKPFDLQQLTQALGAVEIAAAQVCAYCRAESSTHRVRVFTPDNPDGVWPMCDSCWRFLEVGFATHRPGDDLRSRLSASIPVSTAELRGWIRTGLQQVRRQSSPHRP
jgi:CheY-like chemotaxis protein